MASDHPVRINSECSTQPSDNPVNITKPTRPYLTPLILPENHQMVPYFEESPLKPSKITKFMYLGNSTDSQNHKFLVDNGITHILNVTKDEPNCFEGEFKYLKITILDTINQNIATYFNSAHEFIEQARKSDGKILIHCYAGISRSATIVISYLMKTRRMSADTAFQYVKARRSIVSPNIGFYASLVNYYRELNETNGFVQSPFASPPASPFASLTRA
jgi:dual specificity MAP kinase phosphatase